MPAAIRFGISMDVFWELNPKYMYMYQEEYLREKEEQVRMLDAAADADGRAAALHEAERCFGRLKVLVYRKIYGRGR